MGNYILNIKTPYNRKIGVAGSGTSGGGSFSLGVTDSSSITLSMVNSVLQAAVKLSPDSGNIAVIHNNGVYIPAINAGATLSLTGTDFADATHYVNSALAGKRYLIWQRGLGYLWYNQNNPNDAANEYTINLAGGFNITIPNFDVNNGTNFFYVIPN